jgi:hypothetical protein
LARVGEGTDMREINLRRAVAERPIESVDARACVVGVVLSRAGRRRVDRLRHAHLAFVHLATNLVEVALGRDLAHCLRLRRAKIQSVAVRFRIRAILSENPNGPQEEQAGRGRSHGVSLEQAEQHPGTIAEGNGQHCSPGRAPPKFPGRKMD